ncbi:MAG: hypothetical protein IPK97_16730 [Ahniella sp.]|nr:hypothetical protein [Ahniella sp.]
MTQPQPNQATLIYPGVITVSEPRIASYCIEELAEPARSGQSASTAVRQSLDHHHERDRYRVWRRRKGNAEWVHVYQARPGTFVIGKNHGLLKLTVTIGAGDTVIE